MNLFIFMEASNELTIFRDNAILILTYLHATKKALSTPMQFLEIKQARIKA